MDCEDKYVKQPCTNEYAVKHTGETFNKDCTKAYASSLAKF